MNPASMIRAHWKMEDGRRLPTTPFADDAALVSSLTTDGQYHLPVLDLDIPHELKPSATPGHSHLYLDVPMTWEQYERLLTVLAEVGILEANYVNASIGRQATYVRTPWAKKGVGPPLDGGYGEDSPNNHPFNPAECF